MESNIEIESPSLLNITESVRRAIFALSITDEIISISKQTARSLVFVAMNNVAVLKISGMQIFIFFVLIAEWPLNFVI